MRDDHDIDTLRRYAAMFWREGRRSHAAAAAACLHAAMQNGHETGLNTGIRAITLRLMLFTL